MKHILTEKKLHGLLHNISAPKIIFLYGDLGAGKTAFSKSFIRNYLGDNSLEVPSPTYTYYNAYKDIYHFDLYRVEDYEHFVSIGGEEILDNNTGIILIEWPQVLRENYTPDIIVDIKKTDDPEIREISVSYK